MTSSGRLQGKTAVLTGAGAGIGRAIALRFAAEGARVLVSDRKPDTAERTARLVEEAGGEARFTACDVGDESQVQALVKQCERDWDRLDIMVNNAAMVRHAPIAETETKVWNTSLRVTLDGTFFGVRAALAAMLPRKTGAIINISSGAGLGGEPFHGPYGAAKAAVINLTKTAAVENAAQGIRVNSICPGPIQTETLEWALAQRPGGLEGFVSQIPARRLGQVEEIASAALFLASEEASYINGTVLTVDGGIAARTGAPR